MKLQEFITRFSNEERCKEYFRDIRIKEGVLCKKCKCESIDEETIVFSDKSTSYLGIENYVEAHMMEKSTHQTTVSTLKWVHIAISNAKRNFLGVYHKIKRKYLQRW